MLESVKRFGVLAKTRVADAEVEPRGWLVIIMFDGLTQMLHRSFISAFIQIAVTLLGQFESDIGAKVDVRASDQGAEEAKSDESGRDKPRPALPDPLSDKGTPQQQANDSAGPVSHVANSHDVGLREPDAQEVPKHKQ